MLLNYLGLSWIRNTLFRLYKIPVARIIAFHDVPLHLLNNFRANLEVLKNKTNVISLDELFAFNMSMRKLNVVITFDDGYRSWYEYVSPVLKELGLTATFFVSSGFVGQNKAGEALFLRKRLKNNGKTTGGLDENKLRKLAEDGFDIGGHTRNHVNLYDSKSIDEIRREIVTDKELLEKMIEKKVDYFAYPFGLHYNEHINLKCVYRNLVTKELLR